MFSVNQVSDAVSAFYGKHDWSQSHTLTLQIKPIQFDYQHIKWATGLLHVLNAHKQKQNRADHSICIAYYVAHSVCLTHFMQCKQCFGNQSNWVIKSHVQRRQTTMHAGISAKRTRFNEKCINKLTRMQVFRHTNDIIDSPAVTNTARNDNWTTIIELRFQMIWFGAKMNSAATRQ